MSFVQFVSVSAAVVVLIYALHAAASATAAQRKGFRLRLVCLSLAFSLVVGGSFAVAVSTFGHAVNLELSGVAVAAGSALYLIGNRRRCLAPQPSSAPRFSTSRELSHE